MAQAPSKPPGVQPRWSTWPSIGHAAALLPLINTPRTHFVASSVHRELFQTSSRLHREILELVWPPSSPAVHSQAPQIIALRRTLAPPTAPSHHPDSSAACLLLPRHHLESQHLATIMRPSSALFIAFAASAAAQDQVPLLDKIKGYFNQATAAISSAVPAAPSAPVKAASAKAAEQIQHELTLENWKEVVTVDPTASVPTTQDWLVYITGGNATCFGLCGNTTKAWNVRVHISSEDVHGRTKGVLGK